ncbi:MAG: hypothetical protein KF754_07350 [Planctomycetes bacterium]|nr:hypothetical protein [Planctomycetota bacterium]
MVARFCLLFLMTLAVSPLFAQGMSEDYVRERTRARFARPHGITLDWDVLAYGAYFDQMQKVRAEGLPANGIGYSRDFDGVPIGVFLDTEFRLRWSWHDSITASYSFAILRTFEDELEDTTRFNGVAYPAGVDVDYGADWHDLRLTYRRDLLHIGLAGNFVIFGEIGLEWGTFTTRFGSDTFTVKNDRDTERFRELLPWYTAGVGLEWQIGQDIRLLASGRGTYEVGVPTFQKRDGDDMKQSVVSLTGIASFEYAINDWFALVVRAKYRYLKLKLYGGYRSDQFLWYSYGPEVGFGLRF